MVQRKAHEKLSIQAKTMNYVKSDKRITMPSTQHHSDTINKGGGGPELKKKMGKLSSFKHSEFESSGSNPTRRAKSQFDKLRSGVSDVLPNYMKSTNSSTARKEHSQVSSSYFRTTCNSKSRTLMYHDTVKSLTKTSSLKPVRTLTKTSSMKLGRISSKNSGVALYPNQNVSRSTCSSTLKDSKFPTYVMLHSGGTESEGTSIMKVCPYTYCSLNGHHHDSLPQLKCFLSARRRLLRAQKSMRPKGQSPEEYKRKEDVDTGQKIFNRDPKILEEDSGDEAISPLIKEVGVDFFMEIYTQPRDDIDDENDEAKIDFSIDDDDDDAESPRDELSHSEISWEDDLDRISEFVRAETDISMALSKQIQREVEDTDHLHCFLRKETDFKSESESPAESELDDLISEATDVDRKERRITAPYFDNEADCSSTFGENRGSIDEEFGDGDFGPNDGDQTSELSLHDQLFSIENAFEEPTVTKEETNGDSEQDGFINSGVSSAAAEYSLEKSVATSGENYGVPEPDNAFLQGRDLLGDDKPTSIDDVEYGTLMSEQENKSLEDESEMDPNTDIEVGCQINELDDEGFQHKAQTFESLDSETNQGVASRDLELDQVLPGENVRDGAEEKDKVEDVNGLMGIQISGSSQVFSETNQDIGNEDCHTGAEEENTIINEVNDTDEQFSENFTNLKKSNKVGEEPRNFNPREPRYLPMEPDPEAEKVDLKHQMMDERKNAEEWMLDYALRKATTKLAPARKRKVALLVEAFEMVTPLPKYESNLQHKTAFLSTRPIQACS